MHSCSLVVGIFLCVRKCIPLGDNRGDGPSINVGGERKALVSDAGRPTGEGPYGDLSAGGGEEFSEKSRSNVWWCVCVYVCVLTSERHWSSQTVQSIWIFVKGV